MRLTTGQLRSLIEKETKTIIAEQTDVIEEAGPRVQRSARLATSEAVAMLAKRASLLAKDVMKLRAVARTLEQAGYSWNDHAYRSLLNDIGEAERALNMLTNTVKLLQRDLEGLEG